MTKISVGDVGYIAGLFDGEGSLHIRRGLEKKKKHKGKPGYRMSNSMRISMEISMTDEMVIRWVHEILAVGTVIRRDIKGKTKSGVNLKHSGVGDVHLEIVIMYVDCYGHMRK